MIRFMTLPGLAALFLASCGSNGTLPSVTQFSEPELVVTRQPAPPNAAPGTCWGQDSSPAVIETVTEQILLQPAQIAHDGAVTHPAVYKTETMQRIVKERQEIWFESPCGYERDPEFVSTLQRALKARGLYRGAITGVMDKPTQKAVRRYQAPEGLNSGILSVAAARKLGIVAVAREAEGG